MNWLNLLATQETLKSLLQHHGSKAPGALVLFLWYHPARMEILALLFALHPCHHSSRPLPHRGGRHPEHPVPPGGPAELLLLLPSKDCELWAWLSGLFFFLSSSSALSCPTACLQSLRAGFRALLAGRAPWGLSKSQPPKSASVTPPQDTEAFNFECFLPWIKTVKTCVHMSVQFVLTLLHHGNKAWPLRAHHHSGFLSLPLCPAPPGFIEDQAPLPVLLGGWHSTTTTTPLTSRLNRKDHPAKTERFPGHFKSGSSAFSSSDGPTTIKKILSLLISLTSPRCTLVHPTPAMAPQSFQSLKPTKKVKVFLYPV